MWDFHAAIENRYFKNIFCWSSRPHFPHGCIKGMVFPTLTLKTTCVLSPSVMLQPTDWQQVFYLSFSTGLMCQTKKRTGVNTKWMMAELPSFIGGRKVIQRFLSLFRSSLLLILLCLDLRVMVLTGGLMQRFSWTWLGELFVNPYLISLAAGCQRVPKSKTHLSFEALSVFLFSFVSVWDFPMCSIFPPTV